MRREKVILEGAGRLLHFEFSRATFANDFFYDSILGLLAHRSILRAGAAEGVSA